MKKYLFLSILLAISVSFIFGSCQKGSSSVKKGNASITGIDMRKCASPMCGGYFIKLDEDPDVTYRTLSLPEDFTFHYNDLPFRVFIKYKHLPCETCQDKLIEIIKISKAQ